MVELRLRKPLLAKKFGVFVFVRHASGTMKFVITVLPSSRQNLQKKNSAQRKVHASVRAFNFYRHRKLAPLQNVEF